MIEIRTSKHIISILVFTSFTLTFTVRGAPQLFQLEYLPRNTIKCAGL